MLRVHLFGRPRLLLDAAPIPALGRPKVVPLLAYLVLHRDAPVARRTIASALWPDASDDDARANLRRHLGYLQSLLPEAPPDRPWLAVTAAAAGWNPEAHAWIDVVEFERLAAQPDRLAEAAGAYGGALLDGVDEEWVEPPRARLAELYRSTMRALVARLRAARDYPAAIAAAQRLLADDPWHEDVVRSLLQLRHESGDRAGALAEYERFARMLLDELATAPMPETHAVYEAIVRDEPPALARGDPSGSAARRDAGAPHALPFVGRDAELRVLQERAAEAASGRGGLAIVGGEAGIGKTRLVRELATRCEAAGMQCYLGATPSPETTPYQPFLGLLRGIAPLAAASGVDAVWLRAIAPLVPAFAPSEDEPGGPLTGSAERVRLFEACAAVWEAIAARRPALLVIENVHWAGPATLALLEHLARAATRARLLIVATYREDDLPFAHPLRALRRTLQREGVAVSVALGRLARDDVGALLRALGESDPARAAPLHACSDGNPLFIEQLLRDFAETGRMHEHEIAGRHDASGLPPAMRALLAERIGRLGTRAQALAAAAAVIGRAFDVELLREASGWLEADVLDALGELTDHRIVGERGGFDYAFSHHLIEAMVYDGIPAAARTRRHRRVAQVLEALYADRSGEIAGELALHWDRGGEPAAAGRHYLAAARHAAAVYGYDEAAAALDRALQLPAPPRDRFEALLLRERVAAAAGDRTLQDRLLRELAAAARDLDDDAACTVLARRAALADVTGDRRMQRVAIALLARRTRRCADVRHRIALLEAEARYRRAMHDFASARDACAQLVDLARASGDAGAHANARLALADTYIYEGRPASAYPILDELREAVRADGDRAALVRTLIAMTRATLAQQDYAAMSRFAAEAYDLSVAIGDREGEALALHTTANAHLAMFQVRDAESSYARALDLYERIGHRVGLASIFVDLGLFHTELGQLDRALTFYARAKEIADELGFRYVACVERIDAAYAHRLRGEPAIASAAAHEALAIARAIPSPHLESAALGTLAAAECALGAYADAVTHAETAVEMRRASGPTPRLGDNLCALALACARAGEPARAAAAAAELLALYDANPKLAPQPAEWLWAAAEAELANGRRRAARDLLRRAASVARARAAAIETDATRAAYAALPFNRAVEQGLAAV